MNPRYLYVCLLAILLAVPVFAADSPMKPGKWQITVQMEMPGMPFKMPPITTSHCITQEDLEKDPQSAIPKDKKSDCKIGEYKVNGKTVTWTVDCPKQKSTGEGEITFTDESYTGTMKLKSEETEIVSKYTGKFLGACAK